MFLFALEPAAKLLLLAIVATAGGLCGLAAARPIRVTLCWACWADALRRFFWIGGPRRDR